MTTRQGRYDVTRWTDGDTWGISVRPRVHAGPTYHVPGADLADALGDGVGQPDDCVSCLVGYATPGHVVCSVCLEREAIERAAEVADRLAEYRRAVQ